MDVRQARPTDAPLALALALDDAAQVVTAAPLASRSPVWRLAAQAACPMAFAGRLWVGRDGSNLAVLQAAPRQYVIGWDVVRLAVHGEADGVVGGLIGAATAHLQHRGVPRLFARCSVDHRDVLLACGFVSLAREYIMVGPSNYSRGETALDARTRYRMPQDAWPLHQLESETTPPYVRQMEGLTSSDWSGKTRDVSEIVVEQEGRIVAWISWGSKPLRGIVPLNLLVRPENRDVAPQLLLHALNHAPAGTRFSTHVREYRVDCLQSLLDAGFTITGEDAVMVKHAGVEPAVTEASALQRLAQAAAMRAVKPQTPTVPARTVLLPVPSLAKGGRRR